MINHQNILFLQNRVAYIRDEEAYKKLFLYFHPSLYRFCLKLTKSPEVSDEIVSDVMLKIWLMENKLTYIEHLHLYLFKAIKNSAFTYLAKQKMQTVSLDEMQQDMSSPESDAAEHHLMLSETQQEMERAVGSLSFQCQMVFRLIRDEGFSYKQVSTILEISQNTIETHMRIALKKIRLALDLYLQGKK